MGALMDRALRPMRSRNYRLFWLGFIVSNAGAWIQSVAQGWLVYDISGSAAWLGAVGFVRAIPLLLFSLVGGTAADRLDKKRILYATQALQALSALGLAVLTYAGAVEVWHVIALASLSAVAQAFDQPARHALMPSLVERQHLHAAISLNAIAFNGAAVFGPSLTGVLVPWVGLAGCFMINAVSYVAVFLALTLMEIPPHHPRRSGRSMMAELIAGVRYIRAVPTIKALISMAAVTSFAARPYQQFITVFAKDVLHGTVGLAGLMQSAPSLGTIIFMLAVASLGNIQWKGRLLIISAFGLSLGLAAFAWSQNVYLSLVLLVISGGFQMTWMTTVNTLLQTSVGDEMRGRVMSAYTITALAMMPLGQGPMGLSVERLGPHWALTLGAGVALGWVIYMAFFRVPAIRRMP